MRLNFTGSISNQTAGIEALTKRLNMQLDKSGTPVKGEQRAGDLEIKAGSGGITICYQEKIHFFRGLGILAERLGRGETEFHVKETPRFKTNGLMADCSRNAVLTVDSVKDIIEAMALMGLNLLMLYTEDTYELEDYPYFGYMRGRYTYNELKECDDYADAFGVEIVPCIQTLAHLTEALKWSYAANLKDTPDILLAGSDSTYEFIEAMIKAAAAPFRTKRIHIGMDEAFNVGLGRYLAKNGYKNRFDIMNGHLEKVMEITKRHGLAPMIWSDMYFRLASPTGDYYDDNADIPQGVIDRIPREVQMVYWDYYHTTVEEYKGLIKKHKAMGLDVIFAGGVWTWNGIAIDYDKTFDTTNPALTACKEEGVKEVFATMWGDNGNETSFYAALLGMQLFAEHGYSETVDNERLKSRFAVCTGQDMDAFLALGKLNKRTEFDRSMTPDNPSKCLLWQDILLGLFDKHIEGDFAGYYNDLASRLESFAKEGKYAFLFDTAAKTARVLSLKADLGVRLKAAYDAKDMGLLGSIVGEELPRLKYLAEDLRLAHMDQWFAANKPFGWEVIDIRYGGLIARINTAIRRVNQLLKGEISSIPELEEARLFFNGEKGQMGKIPQCNIHRRIASASVM